MDCWRPTADALLTLAALFWARDCMVGGQGGGRGSRPPAVTAAATAPAGTVCRSWRRWWQRQADAGGTPAGVPVTGARPPASGGVCTCVIDGKGGRVGRGGAIPPTTPLLPSPLSLTAARGGRASRRPWRMGRLRRPPPFHTPPRAVGPEPGGGRRRLTTPPCSPPRRARSGGRPPQNPPPSRTASAGGAPLAARLPPPLPPLWAAPTSGAPPYPPTPGPPTSCAPPPAAALGARGGRRWRHEEGRGGGSQRALLAPWSGAGRGRTLAGGVKGPPTAGRASFYFYSSFACARLLLLVLH